MEVKGCEIMKDVYEVNGKDVFSLLTSGVRVYAVIFKSRLYPEGIKNLREWTICEIERMLRDDGVIKYYQAVI